MVGLGLFSNSRKKLKELMYDRPDLFQLIEQINYNRLKDEQLIEVLKNMMNKILIFLYHK